MIFVSFRKCFLKSTAPVRASHFEWAGAFDSIWSFKFMNTNFKVVFNKARGALMVANEITSSVQAKGTKTVVAAAVAAVMAGAAGTAMAEGTQKSVADAVVNTGVTLLQKDGVVDATGVVDKSTDTVIDATTQKVDSTTNVLLNGGTLSIELTKGTEQTFAVKNLSGDGNLTLKSFGAAAADDAKAATISGSSIALGAGTLTLSSTDGKVAGAFKVVANSGASFGVADELYANGEIKTPGKAFDTVVAAGQDLTLESTTESVSYNKGTITNAGTLTLNAVAANKSVTVTDQVAFANTGLIQVTSSGEATFNADYDATVDTNKGGRLYVSGTTVNVGGALKADEVKIGGDFTTDAEDATKITDTASIALNAGDTGSVNVQEGAELAAATLTLAGDTTNVYGAVAAEKTNVTGTATVNVQTTTGSNNETITGTVALGDITVAAATKQDSLNSLTLSNSGKEAVTAASLTIAAGEPSKTYAGTFSLTKGAFSVEKLANNGTVTLNDSASGTMFTVTGESVNAGTITLTNDKDNFVVAEGASLTNTGLIGGAAVNAVSGTLTVAGTLVNKETGKLYTTNLVVDGTLETGVVTTDETPAKAFQFTNITLNESGKINVVGTAEELNQFYESDASGTTLKLHDGEWNLKGGTIEVNGTNVLVETSDVVLGSANATTLNVAGAYALGDISLATGATSVNVVAKDGAALTAGKVALTSDTASAGSLTVEEGAVVTVDELSLKNFTTTVSGGSLTINDKLTTTASNGTVAVQAGALNTSLAALGLKLGATAGADAGNVADQTITLGQDGSLKVSDDLSGVSVKKADLAELTGKLATGSKGLIDLGAIQISDLDASKPIKQSDLLAGIKTDALSQATITEVTGITQSADYGLLKLAGSDGKLSVSEATLTLNGTGNLVTYDKDAQNKDLLATNIELASGSVFQTTGAGAVIGGVTTKADDETDVKLGTLSGDLTVKGDVAVNTIFVKTGSAMTIAAAESGAEAWTVNTKNFKLDSDAAFTAEDAALTIAGTAYNAANDNADQVSYVDGTLKVKDLTTNDLFVNGSANVTGKLSVTGTVYVGSDEAAGNLVVGELASGAIFADPAWDENGNKIGESLVAVKTVAEAATVEAGRSSIVALGTLSAGEAQAAFAKTGYVLAETPVNDVVVDGETVKEAVKAYDTHTVNSVVYVNGGKAEGQAAQIIKGNVVAGDADAPTTGAANVTINANSMLIIDAATVETDGSTAVFGKTVTLQNDSILYIDNVAFGQKIELSATELNDYGAEKVFEGDLLMDAVSNETDRTIEIKMIDKADLAKYEIADLAGFDAAYGMFEEGKNLNNNSSSAQFNKWLYSTTTSPVWQKFSDGSYDVNLSALKKITTDVASLGATTGVQTLTMDAVNQMADTVADRTSVLTQRGQGVNVWADVNGGKFEAKKLFDGAGYSSDIYSGVLGLDYQFSCNAVLGAALTIGTADTDSKNTGVAASTDTDLVGFSVYASKTFADIWNVAADIGYLSASNDVTANGYDHAWKFSQDTDAFTVGVRGEVLTKAGVVNIVPHVGLRYTALSTDGFEAGYVTDIDDQNIFQMPVGVALSADFETNGWTLAPKFDLSVVPTFGDKDADLKLGISGVSATDDLSVRVIDSNPVQATLGINATNGDWGFGLSYKLGAGSDERMNNSFNATVRYAF